MFLVPTKIGQILAILGVWGQGFQKVSIFTAKGTSVRESTSFETFCVKIGVRDFKKFRFLLQKGTSVRESTSFEPFCVKIGWGV